MRVPAFFVAFGWLLASCASKSPSEAQSSPQPTAASPQPVRGVSAVLLANECKGLREPDQKRVLETMNRLVDGCWSVPHGSVRFDVVLHPGGGLQFGGNADAGGGEIPLCVLSHKLTHEVKLSGPCTITVRLDESQLR